MQLDFSNTITEDAQTCAFLFYTTILEPHEAPPIYATLKPVILEPMEIRDFNFEENKNMGDSMKLSHPKGNKILNIPALLLHSISSEQPQNR